MTLSLPLQQPRKTLSIAECYHRALNKTMRDRVCEALRRGNWTCHVCGVHLPGLMEIDHFDSHDPGSCDRIAPICQFRHDLKHPLWSVHRDRLMPVMVPPEIDQRTLTRLSWIIISSRLHDPQNAESLAPVIRDLKRYRIDDSSVFGLLHIADLFESLPTVAEFSGVEYAEEIVHYLQPRMRFLPRVLIDVNALRESGAADFRPTTSSVPRNATRRPFAHSEAEAVIARFMPREEGAGAGAQDDFDGAASCDSDCSPYCDAGDGTEPPGAGAASMDAAPAPQTEATGISEPRCGLQGTLAFASDPNRDSNDEGMKP